MFDWDANNIAHVEDHGFSSEDVEAAVTDPGRVSAPAYNQDGEKRKSVIGKTDDDVIIFVVTTRRGDQTRVVTARDAERNEKRRYRRRGK